LSLELKKVCLNQFPVTVAEYLRLNNLYGKDDFFFLAFGSGSPKA
jgi:hypothetical protein